PLSCSPMSQPSDWTEPPPRPCSTNWPTTPKPGERSPSSPTINASPMPGQRASSPCRRERWYDRLDHRTPINTGRTRGADALEPLDQTHQPVRPIGIATVYLGTRSTSPVMGCARDRRVDCWQRPAQVVGDSPCAIHRLRVWLIPRQRSVPFRRRCAHRRCTCRENLGDRCCLATVSHLDATR